jgi:hypothetical protein
MKGKFFRIMASIVSFTFGVFFSLKFIKKLSFLILSAFEKSPKFLALNKIRLHRQVKHSFQTHSLIFNKIIESQILTNNFYCSIMVLMIQIQLQ